MGTGLRSNSSRRIRRWHMVKIVLAFLIAGEIANLIIAVFFALSTKYIKSNYSNQATSESVWEIRQVVEVRRFGSRWVLSYRSRYPAWHPMQATGPPDTPVWGDIYSAWASLNPDDQEEWLQLEYEMPIEAVAITIYETYAPGALSRVEGITEDDRKIEIWRGIDPTPPTSSIGVSRIAVNPPAPLKSVRLHLASPQIPNWNEIDAVGLVDADGREHWAVRATASTTYASLSGSSSQGNPDEVLPSWSDLDHPRLPYLSGQRNYEHIVQVAFGWPLPTLAVEYELADIALGGTSAIFQVNGGFPTGRSLRKSAVAPGLAEMIPYLPLWSGLVVNMVFYAILLPTPFLVARFAIRFRRRLLGLCITCGYDLRGLDHEACPECGTGVRKFKPA